MFAFNFTAQHNAHICPKILLPRRPVILGSERACSKNVKLSSNSTTHRCFCLSIPLYQRREERSTFAIGFRQSHHNPIFQWHSNEDFAMKTSPPTRQDYRHNILLVFWRQLSFKAYNYAFKTVKVPFIDFILLIISQKWRIVSFNPETFRSFLPFFNALFRWNIETDNKRFTWQLVFDARFDFLQKIQHLITINKQIYDN